MKANVNGIRSRLNREYENRNVAIVLGEMMSRFTKLLLCSTNFITTSKTFPTTFDGIFMVHQSFLQCLENETSSVEVLVRIEMVKSKRAHQYVIQFIYFTMETLGMKK